MPLSKEILFHGTSSPRSIGRPASHGCMRMHNSDAEEIAWHLQNLFSEKKDPGLRDLYKRNRKKTYVVSLHSPVPVKIMYQPAVVDGAVLHLYPDYYHKLGARKKAVILDLLTRHGIDPTIISDAQAEETAKSWPKRGKSDILIESLLTAPLPKGFDGGRKCP